MIEYTVRVYGDITEWWLNGVLHREDGPAVEFTDGTKMWRLNGKLHREDGPAYVGANGYKEWWLNGKRHRVGGPAVEFPNGDNEWWLNDVFCYRDFPIRKNPFNIPYREGPIRKSPIKELLYRFLCYLHSWD